MLAQEDTEDIRRGMRLGGKRGEAGSGNGNRVGGLVRGSVTAGTAARIVERAVKVENEPRIGPRKRLRWLLVVRSPHLPLPV